jgi:hypothetical protein
LDDRTEGVFRVDIAAECDESNGGEDVDERNEKEEKPSPQKNSSPINAPQKIAARRTSSRLEGEKNPGIFSL